MQSFEIIFRDIRSDVNFDLEKNVRAILIHLLDKIDKF